MAFDQLVDLAVEALGLGGIVGGWLGRGRPSWARQCVRWWLSQV